MVVKLKEARRGVGLVLSLLSITYLWIILAHVSRIAALLAFTYFSSASFLYTKLNIFIVKILYYFL
jgi:hypothetical protein